MKPLLGALRVLVLLVAWSRVADAAPIRIVVAMGSPTGLTGDQTLVHPRDDARGVLDVFTTMGGVTANDALFVPDARASSLRDAFDRAEALARGHTPNEVSFLFYFSGHGDHDALHLAGEAFSLDELRERIARVPAALRLVVIDACRTSNDRAKGMTAQPGFAIAVTPSQSASGTAWLFASSDGEVAQESDEIGGALFSHFWTTGLRGAADVDGDGRVTLQESFDFAYAQTLLRSARSGAALQRPQEKLDLSIAGPVVLTQLVANRAHLVLPADRDVLYLVYGSMWHALEAELFASPDRATSLTLPPGRYLVQRRVGGAGAATEVLLSEGEVHEVDPASFHTFSPETLALKSEMVVRPWSVTVTDGAIGGIGLDIGDEGAVAVERRWGATAAALRVFGGWGEKTTPANHVYETSFGAEASVALVARMTGRLDVRFGIDLRGEGVHQEVKRKDAAAVETAGYPGTASYTGTLCGGGVHTEARLDLSTTWYLDANVRALGLGGKTDSGVEGRLLFGAFVGAGSSF